MLVFSGLRRPPASRTDNSNRIHVRRFGGRVVTEEEKRIVKWLRQLKRGSIKPARVAGVDNCVTKT